MTNYLAHTPNPWNLAAPPDWFLVELAAYDAELRIFPSQEEPCYRFARKAKVHPAVMSVLKSRPDTKTYWQHGLVPVTSLPQFEPWSPRILFELAEHDMQRIGGAAVAADILDQHDDRVDARRRIATADGADMRAIDMYREMKHATGQRVSLSTTRFEGRESRPDVPRRKAHRPSHWRGTSGAVFAR